MATMNRDVILVQPSGKHWQPGISRGQSTSDGYELALLVQALNDAGISSEYFIQRPLGRNQDFYQGTKRVIPNPPSLEALTDEILNRKPRMVGIEVMSCYEENARALARMLKERADNITIVAGGYHPNGYPEMLRDAKGDIDYLVLGPGEKGLINLAHAVLKGENPLEGRTINLLPNLGLHDRSRLLNQSAYASINNRDILLAKRQIGDMLNNFDELQFPLRKREYQEGAVSGVLANITPDKQVMATMQTRRGCFAACTYCATSSMYGLSGKKLFTGSQARKVEKIVEELKYLSHMGVNFVFFTDPTFNEAGAHLEGIANGIISAKLGGEVAENTAFYAMFFPFNQEAMKKRGLTFQQYAHLKKAGFTRIAFGVESPRDDVLTEMKRRNTLSDLEMHLNAAHESGIFTRGFMMYGHETETMDSLAAYEDVMKNLPIDEWRIAPMTPFVGTLTGDRYLAKQERIDFSKHDAEYPIIIPEEIRRHHSSEDEARQFLLDWQRKLLQSIYRSSIWQKRMHETWDKFPKLRGGIEFYLEHLGVGLNG